MKTGQTALDPKQNSIECDWCGKVDESTYYAIVMGRDELYPEDDVVKIPGFCGHLQTLCDMCILRVGLPLLDGCHCHFLTLESASSVTEDEARQNEILKMFDTLGGVPDLGGE